MNPQYPIAPKEHQECFHCGDLGVISTKEIHSEFETLMLCACREGENQTYRLPRWEHKLGAIFKRSRCPISWFKPEKQVLGVGREMRWESIASKIDYWRAKIQIAEGYWAQAKKESEGA